MKKQYLFVFLFCLVSSLSAQSIADCASGATSAIPVDQLQAAIDADGPLRVGQVRAYCISATINSNLFMVMDGTVLNATLTTDPGIVNLPATVNLTDVTVDPMTTQTFTTNGMTGTVVTGRNYYIEVSALEAGPLTIQAGLFGFNQSATIDILAALPVTWGAPLSVKNESKLNVFSWSVTAQEEVDVYELQRSRGDDFETVEYVSPNYEEATEIWYEAVDELPSETTFYRVRQTDFDGSESFTNTIAVRGVQGGDELIAFPNPVSERLQFSYADAVSSVRLLSVLGREVRAAAAGQNSGEFNVSDLPAGLYLLDVATAEGDRIVRKIQVR